LLDIHIKEYISPLTEETSLTVFGDSFWENIDCVISAVDNIEARQLMDSLCLFYNKPMFDSGIDLCLFYNKPMFDLGTEGLAGSSQVI
jgi:molybdopterin/thiamine biosynthesis adenylyltransferase